MFMVKLKIKKETCTPITLLVPWYGCETWSPYLTENTEGV